MIRYGLILPICLATVITPQTALAELLETIKGPDNHLGPAGAFERKPTVLTPRPSA